MFARISIAVLFGSLFFQSCTPSDREILEKTNQALQQLDKISYVYDYENYDMMGELGMHEAIPTICDFDTKDTLTDYFYHHISDNGDSGSDGVNEFYSNKEKAYSVYSPVSRKEGELNYVPYSTFSIQMLRKHMPTMLEDSCFEFYRTADTVVNNKDCYKFSIKLRNKGFDMFNRLITREENKNSYGNYTIAIDKSSHLPQHFLQYTQDFTPGWKIHFHDFDLSPSVSDTLFDYKLCHANYAKYNEEEARVVQQNETIADDAKNLGKGDLDWTLPAMSGDSVTFSEIDAPLILLEFWFPYCTGCVLAIPEINEIQKTYKDKGLAVYGIEFRKDDNKNLADYIEKSNIEYPTLYAAKEVASRYGVFAGPTFFLISKEGKVLYARSGFIKEELLKHIDANLIKL